KNVPVTNTHQEVKAPLSTSRSTTRSRRNAYGIHPIFPVPIELEHKDNQDSCPHGHVVRLSDCASTSIRASPKSPAPPPHSPVQLSCGFEFDDSVNDPDADLVTLLANEPITGCVVRMQRYSRDYGNPALVNKRSSLSIGDSSNFALPVATYSTFKCPHSTSCDYSRSPPSTLMRSYDTVSRNGDEYLCMLYERHAQVTSEMDTLKAELLQLMREEWTLTGVVPDGYEALQSQVQRCTQPIKNTSFRLPRSVLQRASTIAACRQRPALKRCSQTSVPDSTSYRPPELVPRPLDQPNATALPDRHGDEAKFFTPLSSEVLVDPNTVAPHPVNQTPHHQSFSPDAFPVSSDVQADSSTASAVCQNVTSISPGAMGVTNITHSEYGFTKSNSNFDPRLSLFEEEISIERAAAELHLRRLEVDHAVISHLHRVHKQRAAETKREAYKIAYRTNYQKLREIEEQMKQLRAELDQSPTSNVPENGISSSNCAFRTRKTWKPLCNRAKNWALATLPRRSSTCLSPAKSNYRSWDTVSSPCSPNVRTASMRYVPQPPPSLVSGSISLSTSGTSSIVSSGIAESIEDQPYPIRAPRRRRQSLLPLLRIFKHSKHTSSASERVDEACTTFDLQLVSELPHHAGSTSCWKTDHGGSLHCASEQQRVATTERNLFSSSQQTQNCIGQTRKGDEPGGLCHSQFNDTKPNYSSGGIFDVKQLHLPSYSHERCGRLRYSTSASSVIERNQFGWTAFDHTRHEVARTWSLPILSPLNDSGEIHIHGYGDTFRLGSRTIGDAYSSKAFRQWSLKEKTTSFKPIWASDPPNSPISISSVQHLTSVVAARKDTPTHVTSQDPKNVSPSWSTSGCSCMSSQTAGSTSPCDSGCFASSKATDSAIGLYSCQSLKSDTPTAAFQSVPSASRCPSSGLPVKLREPCDRGRRVVTCDRGASSTTESEAFGSTFHVKCICSCISELLIPEGNSHSCHKNTLPNGTTTYPILNSPDMQHDIVPSNNYAVPDKAHTGSSGSCDVTLIRSPLATASSISSVTDASPISCTDQKLHGISSRNKHETTPSRKRSTSDSKSVSFFRRAVTRIASTRDSMRCHDFSSSSLYRRRRFTGPRVVPSLLTRKHSEFREFFKLGRHEYETDGNHPSQNVPAHSLLNTPVTSNALSPKCARVGSIRFSARYSRRKSNTLSRHGKLE
ncbi:unnamed protein product, partial [Dicrocoelium dendriticum]